MKILLDHTDMELLTLFINGHEQAFNTIYRRYAGKLYTYARKSISVKEDCEEIVQDIFESIWNRREKLTHLTALEAYLFGMVKYKVIRYFHHSLVKRKYEEHYKFFEAVYDSMDDVEKEPSIIQNIIDNGLSELPERCQQAIKLRLIENLSNADIAKRMNIKKTAVENYMVTALNHLRASYATSRKRKLTI
ncbi:sigma-70 family RNA polymerase sigma factor [Chryseolinea soli]|uniref:Sigma-70 family RNA polymerase sigma factor n=1 Tax=Chryseolinea soli TaxID=2321403 RepID=A0A385SPY8_9BACT|nr:sigma-70 family RNA polymerase sigma factor [Chryseolinea soli]AYB32025.1 sigma-70 family RNA polymerase sigma factor [Chryseolinea soli]